ELDVRVTLDDALRLEAAEGELLDVVLEGHAVLEAHRDADGEAVHQRAEGGAFLVHVDEDLAERAVLVLTGAEEDLVPADARLLREAGAARREAVTHGGRRTRALADGLGRGGRDLLHDRGLL